MKTEHIAFNVQDPFATAKWWVAHLGFRIVREMATGCFVADSDGTTVFELYHNPNFPVPDFATQPSAVMHIAVTTPDVIADRDRLVQAGGRADGDLLHNADGDVLCIVRDPGGISLQLVQRARPLV